MFQSAPAIAGGRIHNGHSVCVAVEMVSIRARHCWRANRGLRTAGVPVQRVSIRARHCWRANLRLGLRSLALCLFQSAPAIAGGRIRITRTAPVATSCFNPRPPLLAGESVVPCPDLRGRGVSIRARHCWRANPTRHAVKRALFVNVSIRARHCWRANPASAAATSAGSSCFNPRPPLLAGESSGNACLVDFPDCFNPRPPLLAGESRLRGGFHGCPQAVSIRARHCWRANPWHLLCAALTVWFQSAPAIAGGRIASYPKPCRHSIFSCFSANLAIKIWVCKTAHSKKSNDHTKQWVAKRANL